MPTIFDNRNSMDQTVRIFDAFYNINTKVNADEFDIVQNLKQELKTSFVNGLRQQPNQTRNLQFKFDNYASGPGAAAAAGSPPIAATGGTSEEQTTDPNKGPAFNVNVTFILLYFLFIRYKLGYKLH